MRTHPPDRSSEACEYRPRRGGELMTLSSRCSGTPTPCPSSSGAQCYRKEHAVIAGSDGRSFSSTIIELGKHNPGKQNRQLLPAFFRPNLSIRNPLDLPAQNPQIGP